MMNDITVIHVVKNASGTSAKFVEKKNYHSRLRSVTGYYSSRAGLFSAIRYFLFLKKLIDDHIRDHGKPDLVNVHICYKAGVGALYCKWRYGIKYLVSEQWTIFCPEAKPSFHDQPFVARWLMKKIYRNAFHSSAVSNYLAQSLVQRFAIRAPLRIPNVVDVNLFFPDSDKHEVFTFIHISVLNYQKSPEEIIDAVLLLKRKTSRSFRFIIYGPFKTGIAAKIKEAQLDDVIDYRTEVLQNVLAAEVRRCHSLVLYSRFETFGCVVIEAFAAGLPVIASDIPVMRELVQENITGIFAQLDQPATLAEKMLWMTENYDRFDAATIARKAKDFSFEQIGKMFDLWYLA
jgi:glycosyltransferase involved in cell wall biosynthesis